MRDLAGKTAWITGAGTGIGKAAALALSDAGMNLVLSGRRKAKLDEAAEDIGNAAEDACEDLKDAANADDTDC